MTHATTIEVRSWPMWGSRLVARCDCGWRGRPHFINNPGRRAVQREAAKHRKDHA